jgi:RNA 2',3'-cyclic 3'-phosphodiesterase
VGHAIRAFIAVPLEGAVTEALGRLSQRLAPYVPSRLRWVPPASMHITLKFLGDVLPSMVEAVADVARRASDMTGPVALPVGGLTAFPSPARPRVLSVALHDVEGKIARVARFLEDEFEPLGFAREGRAFRPHITLARASRQERLPSLEPVMASVEIDDPVEIWADRVWLMQSELTPRGPLYTPMARFDLSGP